MEVVLRAFATTSCPLYVALYTSANPPLVNGRSSISSNPSVNINEAGKTPDAPHSLWRYFRYVFPEGWLIPIWSSVWDEKSIRTPTGGQDRILRERTSWSLSAKSLASPSFKLITCSTPALLASMNAGTSTTQVSVACFRQAETTSIDGRAEGLFSQHFCRLSQTLSVKPNFSESLGLDGRSFSRTTLQASSVFPLLGNGGVPVST